MNATTHGMTKANGSALDPTTLVARLKKAGEAVVAGADPAGSDGASSSSRATTSRARPGSRGRSPASSLSHRQGLCRRTASAWSSTSRTSSGSTIRAEWSRSGCGPTTGVCCASLEPRESRRHVRPGSAGQGSRAVCVPRITCPRGRSATTCPAWKRSSRTRRTLGRWARARGCLERRR